MVRLCLVSHLSQLESPSDTILLVRKSSFILRKFRGEPPSLMLHLHPTHFRFDQQDGSFTYGSAMRTFLEHVRAHTVPHDMLEELFASQVKFYDGMCPHRNRGIRLAHHCAFRLPDSPDSRSPINPHLAQFVSGALQQWRKVKPILGAQLQ